MSEQELKRIAQESFDPSWPKAGEVWRHYRGGVYDVLAVAVHESELVPLVVYRSRQKGYVWARPVANWLETVDGSPRFERMELIAPSTCPSCAALRAENARLREACRVMLPLLEHAEHCEASADDGFGDRLRKLRTDLNAVRAALAAADRPADETKGE